MTHETQMSWAEVAELTHESADHEGHVAPDSISTGHTQFSGAYVATCNLCDYVCAYWDCACELEHDCVNAKGGVQ